MPSKRFIATFCLCLALATAIQAATISLGSYASFAGPAAGSGSAVVASTAAWTVTSNTSWIHLATTSGTGSALAIFTYDANTGDTRLGSIMFTSSGNSVALSVTQIGTSFTAESKATAVVGQGLSYPTGIAVDGSGNVFIADQQYGEIFMWTAATQKVTTLVPSGLNHPEGITVAGSGNVYVADSNNNAIKQWNAATQQVSTIVSSGLNSPNGVAIDTAEHLYIADTKNNAIKEWDAVTQQVIPLVSSGLSNPKGVAVDSAGNVYIADTGNQAVKMWSVVTQQVTTLMSGLGTVDSVAVDNSGNVYIADNDADLIEEWNAATKQVTTLLSSGLNAPFGVAVDRAGNVYLTDTGNAAAKKLSTGFVGLTETSQVLGPAAASASAVVAVLPAGDALPWSATTDTPWIHLVAASGTTSTPALFRVDSNIGVTRTGTISFSGTARLTVTQAGAAYVGAGVVNTFLNSGLRIPGGIALDNAGNVYIADSNNNAVKEWHIATQKLTTLVASGLSHPDGLAVDKAGNVYIADTDNNAVKEWKVATQELTTLVVEGLNYPIGVALDGDGNLYIADTINSAIKEWLAATHQVITLVSSGLRDPDGIAVDGQGNVYIADTGNGAIKQWNAVTHQVTLLDGASLSYPYGLAVDGAGNVYIADTDNQAIKEWNVVTKQVVTLLGGLAYPLSIAVDGSGGIYFTNEVAGGFETYPRGFIGPLNLTEPFTAGYDHLLPVLPATVPVVATSDQAWLQIGAVANAELKFSFAANSNASARVAHISVLGQSVTVTQASAATAGSPAVVSLLPALGTGLTQIFTAVYSDLNGLNDMGTAKFLINTDISGVGACDIFYSPATNALALYNDAGDGATGPLSPGSTSSLSNGQCTLAGVGTSASKSGGSLTLTLALTFSPSFTGAKNVYLAMISDGRVHGSSGWVQKGTWTPASLGAPTVVSLSPAAGTGLTQTFTAIYTDPNGLNDLGSAKFLINTGISGIGACDIFYSPATNALALYNDAGDGATGPLTPGSTSSLSNSQCTLSGGGTSASRSGDALTINLALTFSQSFTGAKNVYVEALSTGYANGSSGWVQEGSWTP